MLTPRKSMIATSFHFFSLFLKTFIKKRKRLINKSVEKLLRKVQEINLARDKKTILTKRNKTKDGIL